MQKSPSGISAIIPQRHMTILPQSCLSNPSLSIQIPQPCNSNTMLKCHVWINKTTPTGQLYERESELGEYGSAQCSTFSMYITDYIVIIDLGKLEPYPKK